uniref:Uncharacterized protein n=1 Tax=Anguilla anguilla TaxID=7936 RepID=A0A0E9V4F0_ANGAN
MLTCCVLSCVLYPNEWKIPFSLYSECIHSDISYSFNSIISIP